MLVQDFLQDSARRSPDKVALICDDQRLTYGEIDAAANRLANALRESGCSAATGWRSISPIRCPL